MLTNWTGVPWLAPVVLNGPKFPYQSLGKLHSQDSGFEDCLRRFVQWDFDTLKWENYMTWPEAQARNRE